MMDILTCFTFMMTEGGILLTPFFFELIVWNRALDWRNLSQERNRTREKKNEIQKHEQR